MSLWWIFNGVERISCVSTDVVPVSNKSESLWPEQKIEGGTSRRPKGFWESARQEILLKRCDERQSLDT